MAKQTKLIKGYSAKTIGKNIGYELKKHPSMSHAQAIAISLSTARTAAPKKMKAKFTKKK
jgi:hypothetical protein